MNTDHTTTDPADVDSNVSTIKQSVWTLNSRRLREIGTIDLSALANGSVSVGSEGTDILLDWPGVAARHLLIEHNGDRLSIEAQAEKTWINDGPLAIGSRTDVSIGDKVALGPIELFIERECIAAAPKEEADSLSDTAEWIERAEVQLQLRRQLSEVETAAAEQQKRLTAAENAVEAALREAESDVPADSVEENVDRYRAIVDDLKLSLVATTNEALDAHRQRLDDLQQRQHELDALRDRIRTRGEVLSQRERRVEERKHSVTKSEEAIRARETQLADTAEEVAEQGRQLDDREKAAWQHDRELDRREAEIVQHETTWQTRLAEVQAQQIDLDRLQSEATKLRAEHASRFEQLELDEATWRQRSDALTRDEVELEAREKQVSSREAAINDQREALRREREAVETERDRLTTVRLELDEQRNEIEEQSATLADRTADVANSEADLKSERDRLDAELAKHSERVTVQEAKLQLREVELRNRELAIELSREELESSSESQSLSSTELSMQGEHLANREAELSRLEAEVRTRTAEIDRREAAQAAAHSEYDSQLAELNERLEALRQSESELTQREAECERTTAEARVEQERLNNLFGAGVVLANGTDEEHSDGELSNGEPSDHETTSQEDEILAAIQEDLKEMRAELEREREALSDERDKASKRDAEFEENRRIVEAERATLEAEKERLESSRDEIDELKGSLDERTEELAKRERAVEQQAQELAESETPHTHGPTPEELLNDDERKEIERQREELDEERKRLQILADDLDARESDLLAMSHPTTTPPPAEAEGKPEQSEELDLVAKWSAGRRGTDVSSADAIDLAETAPRETMNSFDVEESDDVTDAAVEGSERGNSEPGDSIADTDIAEDVNTSDDIAEDDVQDAKADIIDANAAVSEAVDDEIEVQSEDLEAVDASKSYDLDDIDEAVDKREVESGDVFDNHDVFDDQRALADNDQSSEALAFDFDDTNAQSATDDAEDLFGDASAIPDAAETDSAGLEESDIDWAAEVAKQSSDPFSSLNDPPTETSHSKESFQIDDWTQSFVANKDPFDDPTGPVESTRQDVADGDSVEPESTPDADPFAASAPVGEPDMFANDEDTAPEPRDADQYDSETPLEAASEIANTSSSDDDVVVRSQLADMFGVSVSELADAANRTDMPVESTSLFDQGDASSEEPPAAESPFDVEDETTTESNSSDSVQAAGSLLEMFGISPSSTSDETPSGIDDAQHAPADDPQTADIWAAMRAGSKPDETAGSDTSTTEFDDVDNISASEATSPFEAFSSTEAPVHDPSESVESTSAEAFSTSNYDAAGFGTESTDANADDLDSSAFEDVDSTPMSLGRQFDLEETAAPPEASESGEDSVTAYMERLLARSRGGAPAEEPVKVAAPRPIPEQAVESSEPSSPPKERKPIDAEKIRREVVSFREVALMSSRNAVAKSRVKQLRMQLIAKSFATAVGAVVSGTLLASPLWSNESYVMLGIFAMLFTGVIGYFTSRSIAHYRRITDVKSKPSNSNADEA